jgi:hypothetical protein
MIEVRGLVPQQKKEKHLKSWRVEVASEISQLLLLLKARCCISGGFSDRSGSG